MFESAASSRRPASMVVVGCTDALRMLSAAIARSDSAADVSAELVDQIRALEELKSVAAAVQARVSARLAAARRAAEEAAGVPARDRGKGVAAEIALARRDSPFKGARHLGLARALVEEMPHTLYALEAGRLTEWRATLVVRETACLSREHRGQVDAELAAVPGGFDTLGDRTLAAEARRIGYRLDPHAVTDRARRAEAERCVTLRPAPDTMTWLTTLLPARQGVACYAALTKHADSQRARGDERTRGQVMSDTLVERVTGQASADEVPVEVNLVMTEHALLGEAPDPAELEGYGPLPAPLARGWLRGDQAAAAASPAKAWLRRLYTAPDTGALVAMDSTRRCFDGKLRRFVIIRDRRCRTPWCDAPIRHVDHPVRATDGGRTSARNSQGLCEACNYRKEAAGWRTRLGDDCASSAGTTVIARTPTGHTYLSPPPVAIGRPPPAPTSPTGAASRIEAHFRDLVLAV